MATMDWMHAHVLMLIRRVLASSTCYKFPHASLACRIIDFFIILRFLP